ncbi:MAG: hypothetical protein WC231_01280 [Dehalococcoidales bacterium]|jgi:hypothetical protein
MMNIVTGKNKVSNRHVGERTTIGLKTTTKERLDKSRAPGQCYDGFIQQMVEFWEERNEQ